MGPVTLKEGLPSSADTRRAPGVVARMSKSGFPGALSSGRGVNKQMPHLNTEAGADGARGSESENPSTLRSLTADQYLEPLSEASRAAGAHGAGRTPTGTPRQVPRMPTQGPGASAGTTPSTWASRPPTRAPCPGDWCPLHVGSSQQPGECAEQAPAQETGQRMGRCRVSWGQSCRNLHPPARRHPRRRGRAGPSSCFLSFSLRNRTCIPPKSLKHQRRFMKQSCALQRKKQEPPLQGARPCPAPILSHDFHRLFFIVSPPKFVCTDFEPYTHGLAHFIFLSRLFHCLACFPDPCLKLCHHLAA